MDAVAGFDGQTVVLCQVLSGLGGVGKTQAAAALARRLWDTAQVELLVWVTATSRTAIVAGFADAAARITGIDDTDPDHASTQFLAWLAEPHQRRWLIVLDNLDNPDDLSGLWPPTTGGHTVVTTRRRDTALLAGRRLIDVDVFTPGQAITYLHSKLSDQPQRLDETDELAADLGYLPLALAQAAAYILDRGSRMTCAAYRHRLGDQRRRLADLAPHALPDQHPDTVAATWNLSIDRADQLIPHGVARPVLELAALLDPNGIPVDVLTAEAVVGYCTSRLGRRIDADDLDDALHILHRFSLLTLAEATNKVRVHALVQRAVREGIDASNERVVATAAADALLQGHTTSGHRRTRAQVLWSNTAALRVAAGNLLVDPFTGVHPVLVQAGHTLGNTGQGSAALQYLRELHAVVTPTFGKDHADILVIGKWIAYWTGRSGHSMEAKVAYQELLPDMITAMGASHPETLEVRGGIAWWQSMAGDAHGAVEAFTALLADRVRILGPEHLDTLRTRTDLARCRGQAGDPTGAVAELMELFAIQTSTLGPGHVYTLVTRNNIARYLGEAGETVRALSETQAVAEARSKALGPDHPHTLASREGAALWQWKSGAQENALTALQTLLTDRVRILGPDHHHTLSTRHKLAHWLASAGHHDAAGRALQELLDDQLSVLGSDHPDTMATKAEIAYWQRQATGPAKELIEGRPRPASDTSSR